MELLILTLVLKKILLTENGESTVQVEHSIEDIDGVGVSNANVSSENNLILLTESGETVQLEHNIEGIDGSMDTNVSSENNLILVTENRKTVQLEHNIEDTEGSANANVSSGNNLFIEKRGSSVQLSMKSYCYTWTLNNFFKCLNFYLLEQSADIHFNLHSPNFIFDNMEYCLHLSVITESEKSSSKVKEMNIVLDSKRDIASDLYIKNEVSVVDDNGEIILSFAPKKEIGIGNRKEYSYSFLPLRGTKTFVLPYKLIIRSEFSILISEIRENTGSSLSKSDNQNVVESECCTKNNAASVSPRCTIRSLLPRIRLTYWTSLERVGAQMREFMIPILLALCVLLALISLVDKRS